MPRLSLTEQIAKAAAEGDIEKVKVLGEKLKAQTAKAKPKIKPKPKSKSERKIKTKNEGEAEAEAETIIDPSSLGESDYFVPAKAPKRQRSDIDTGEDSGRRLAQRSPFRKVKRKNTFVDTLMDNVDDIKFDKSWYEKTGNTTQKREKFKKIKVICSRCKRAKPALPTEFITQTWVCSDCLTGLRGEADA